MRAPLDFPPEIAAAIERAENPARKAAIFGIIVSAAESKGRVAFLEACLFASIMINIGAVIMIALVVSLHH